MARSVFKAATINEPKQIDPKLVVKARFKEFQAGSGALG